METFHSKSLLVFTRTPFMYDLDFKKDLLTLVLHLSSRSVGEGPSHFSTAWWKVISHFLPIDVRSQYWAERWVKWKMGSNSLWIIWFLFTYIYVPRYVLFNWTLWIKNRNMYLNKNVYKNQVRLPKEFDPIVVKSMYTVVQSEITV